MRRLPGVGAACLVALAGLTGHALASGPAGEVDRTSIDFGTWNTLNDIVPGGSVKITSTGDEPLILDSAEIDQPEGGPFHGRIYPQSSCSTPVLPGAYCWIDVSFGYHSSAGLWNGTLLIHSNASPEPFEVSLSGTIERTTVELDQDSFYFGSAPLGILSGGPEHKFTITSTGSRPFSPRAYITGSDSHSFKIVGNECEAEIPPGGTCDVTVAFRPAGNEPGTRKANLYAGGGMIPRRATLTGTALERLPARTTVRAKTPKRIRAGARLRIETTVANAGGEDAAPVTIRAFGPKKLIRNSGARFTFLPHGPGASTTRTLGLGVRHKAAGRKITVKLVARQSGKQIWSAKRTIKVLPAR